MVEKQELLALRERVKTGLDEVLTFFAENVFAPDGGYFGRVDQELVPDEDAERLLVLGARLVWSYAAAYRVLGEKKYLDLAVRQLKYMREKFIDPVNGGAYWSILPDGTPSDSDKYPYGNAFLIYGGSELYRAAGNEDGLHLAQELVALLDEHTLDKTNDGYFECYTADWKKKDKSFNVPDPSLGSKALNTHLHMIESYTNLFRAAPTEALKTRVRALIGIMTEKLLDRETFHYKPYMHDDWSHSRTLFSFGHDIEAGWLLTEACEVYGDEELYKACIPITLGITKACEDGLNEEGGMYAEQAADGTLDKHLHWWVQAEAVVGFFNAWQLSGDEHFYRSAIKVLDFIDQKVVNRTGGVFREWISDASLPLDNARNHYPIHGWKTPYHNARMYLELLERLNKMLDK